MKASTARTLSRGRERTQVRKTAPGDVFVICIDRDKLIKELLAALTSRDPSDRRN